MGRDLTGIAQTGTARPPPSSADDRHPRRGPQPRENARSLILEPTRELAAQVAENFDKYGKYHKLNMALLIGGTNMADQIKKLEKGVDVLIATPGG
jgi:superfamily II DNA/RNA helicase